MKRHDIPWFEYGVCVAIVLLSILLVLVWDI